MPDDILTVSPVGVVGTWGTRRLRGQATLVLLTDHLEIRDGTGNRFPVPYVRLGDATIEGETLTLHGPTTDRVQLHAPGHAASVHDVLMEQACRIPEFARGLRALGARRGGAAAMQTRFFAPLLHARRDLRESGPLDRRIARIDADLLRQRVRAAIASMAHEEHVTSPAHRRSLEAHLEEESDELMHALDRLDAAAAAVRIAPLGQRFHAWRVWIEGLRTVFVEADRTWVRMLRHAGAQR